MASYTPVSIEKDIRRIREASRARDYWAVLGIPPGSTFKEIKSCQRRWIRRLHPDRWYASSDMRLRDEIQEAFYEVQAAYYEVLKHCAANVEGGTVHAPITTPAPSLWTKVLERLNQWLPPFRIFDRFLRNN